MSDMTEREMISNLHLTISGLLDGIARAGKATDRLLTGVFVLAISNIILATAVVWLLLEVRVH